METMSSYIPRKEVVDQMPLSWEMVKARFLDSFESRNEGLNIRRVDEFLLSKGIHGKEYRLFFDEDRNEIADRLGPMGFLGNSFSEGNNDNGIFISDLGISLIRRNKVLESLNGPEFTEGIVVHEQSHSSSEYSLYTKETRADGLTVLSTPRIGFSLKQNELIFGDFFEEGFAESFRGEYMAEFLPIEMQNLILKTLWRPQEFTPYSLPPGFYPSDSSTHPLTQKYFYRLTENIIGYKTSSLAAMGMDLLCMKYPPLHQIMLAARHDIDSLREFPKAINKIRPGLYTELRRIPYALGGFQEGLHCIIEKVYGGELPINPLREVILPPSEI